MTCSHTRLCVRRSVIKGGQWGFSLADRYSSLGDEIARTFSSGYQVQMLLCQDGIG